MASDARGDRAERRAAVGAGVPRVAAAPALFTTGQWRIVGALMLSGLGFLLAGMLVPPSGGGYWLAVLLLPAAGVFIALLAAGPPARALDDWLMGNKARPERAAPPPPPAGLPEPARLALQAAALPVLLAELAGAAPAMGGREGTAARALLQAGAAAPDGEARRALARDLPRLLPRLAAGDAAAAAEAEALARQLAQGAAGGATA
jgi:hypothetical protein